MLFEEGQLADKTFQYNILNAVLEHPVGYNVQLKTPEEAGRLRRRLESMKAKLIEAGDNRYAKISIRAGLDKPGSLWLVKTASENASNT